MAETVVYKYRAFISYSHSDTNWAKWLHRQLEGIRIDKDLVGRETATGQVPKSLRPVFRDRDDFAAGHSLTDQTLAALDASSALIVLASPTSAKSRYVNEEIRLFKSHHPDRPVIPVILDGTPGHPEHECFAPALRFEVAADGTVTAMPVEVLAADVREAGDGRNLALAKVVARLLGLATDKVFRRAERERRRQSRWRNGVVAALAVLAVAATGSAVYAWQQLKTNEAFLEATLKRATEIVNTAVAQAEKYNVPRTATVELLTRAEGLFDDMARLGRPTPSLQRQKAWMLIEFARNYAILGDTTKQRERADEAERIMAALAADRGEDLTVLSDLSVARIERGDVLLAQGDLLAAMHSFSTALAIAERLTKADPNNAGWQRGLAVSHNKVGNVLKAQGNLAAALDHFTASLAIRERLAKADNAGWQRELAVSHDRVGDVLNEQGDLGAALDRFTAALAIVERLAKTDPDNAGWQRELAVLHNKIGNVQKAQGNLGAALDRFMAALAIAERLAEADPDNAEWNRDLAVSYGGLADVHRSGGDRDQAMKALRDGQAIMQRVVSRSPGHVSWKRDLELFEDRITELELWTQADQREGGDGLPFAEFSRGLRQAPLRTDR
jgi:tetratricopeptide (TPR) repeat protein